MNILCIGDVVGKPGRKAIELLLPGFIKQRGVDLVVANAENVAGGSGLTGPLFSKLRHHGVDIVTLGDHVYRKREIYGLLEESDRVVRPANLPPEAVGLTFSVIEPDACRVAAQASSPSVSLTPGPGVPLALSQVNSVPLNQNPTADPTKLGRVGFFCLLGRLYMKPVDCPFHAADRVLAQMPPDVKVIIVDVHAEATSEKVALGYYLTGRASIVFGTHTHIQTADECILGNHTAYITDLGMTGPYDSVLGRDKRAVIDSMVTGLPYPFDVAEGDARLCGALVEVDPATGAASKIERIRLDLPA